MPFLCLKPFNDPLRSCLLGIKSLNVLPAPLQQLLPPPLPPASGLIRPPLTHWPLSPCLPVSLQFLTCASGTLLLLGLLPTIPFPWKDTRLSLSSNWDLSSNTTSVVTFLWQASLKSCPCLTLPLPYHSGIPNHPSLLVLFPQHLSPSDIAYVLLILLFTACLPPV